MRYGIAFHSRESLKAQLKQNKIKSTKNIEEKLKKGNASFWHSSLAEYRLAQKKCDESFGKAKHFVFDHPNNLIRRKFKIIDATFLNGVFLVNNRFELGAKDV